MTQSNFQTSSFRVGNGSGFLTRPENWFADSNPIRNYLVLARPDPANKNVTRKKIFKKYQNVQKAVKTSFTLK